MRFYQLKTTKGNEIDLVTKGNVQHPLLDPVNQQLKQGEVNSSCPP